MRADIADEIYEATKELSKQRHEITTQIAAIEQNIMAKHAVAQVGEEIEWDFSKSQKRRGRVVRLKMHISTVGYVVQTITRGGELSDKRTDVYYYHNPRKAAD